MYQLSLRTSHLLHLFTFQTSMMYNSCVMVMTISVVSIMLMIAVVVDDDDDDDNDGVDDDDLLRGPSILK